MLAEIGGRTSETKSDASGHYQFVIDSTGLAPGRYTVHTRSSAISDSGYDYSFAKTVILSKTTLPQADLNKDGVVDLRDLSIFFAHPVDLNGDGNVGLADLSVLLYALSENL